jgi:hypothetical protein
MLQFLALNGQEMDPDPAEDVAAMVTQLAASALSRAARVTAPDGQESDLGPGLGLDRYGLSGGRWAEPGVVPGAGLERGD